MKTGIIFIFFFMLMSSFSYGMKCDSTKSKMNFGAGLCGFVSSNSNGNAGGMSFSAAIKKHTLIILPFFGQKFAFSKSITDRNISGDYGLNGIDLTYRFNILKFSKTRNVSLFAESNTCWYHYRYKGVEDYYSPLIVDDPYISTRNVLEETLGLGVHWNFYKKLSTSLSFAIGAAYISSRFDYPDDVTQYKYFNYSGIVKMDIFYTLF